MVRFDTLRASHRLRDAGFEEKQADALVNAFAEDIGANLATKDDVAQLRQAIEALDSKVDSNDAALRHEMALREDRSEERMKAMEDRLNARMDRQSTRFMVVAVGLAALLLAAIGTVAGILASML